MEFFFLIEFCSKIDASVLDLQVSAKGKELLDYVLDKLRLLEKEYFGLRYLDRNGQVHWLDRTKSLRKQFRKCTVSFPAKNDRFFSILLNWGIFFIFFLFFRHGTVYILLRRKILRVRAWSAGRWPDEVRCLWLMHLSFEWSIDWLIDRSIDWSMDWLVDGLIDRLIDWLGQSTLAWLPLPLAKGCYTFSTVNEDFFLIDINTFSNWDEIFYIVVFPRPLTLWSISEPMPYKVQVVLF